jgi:trans-feruloyl-CoA hydratase/vanillin synthase
MDYREIIVETRERITSIRLNRPEKKNALSPELNRELLHALTEVEGDGEARGLLLTGSGDSFSAGLDLDASFLQTMEASDSGRFRAVMEPVLGWYTKLYQLPIPTVAAVNGHCYGGGVNPVSICDVAVASERAQFGLSEINFAHFPAGGSTWSVTHFLLPKHAYYLCLSGERIDAREAHRIGLVTKVVPHEALEEEAWRIAKVLAGKHPVAYRTAKTMCRMTPRLQLWEAIELEMAHLHENYFLSEGEMVKVALQQFKQKQLRPGAGETYASDEPQTGEE